MTTDSLMDPRLGLISGVAMALSHGVPPIAVQHHGDDRYSVRCGDLTVHGSAETLRQLAADLAAAIDAAAGFSQGTTTA
jgi:hypothetical protein